MEISMERTSESETDNLLIQKVLKELNLDNKQLTREDTTKVFEYMQEICCIES